MREAPESPHAAVEPCAEPLCGGATEFYQKRAQLQSDFIDACYASAPARVRQALGEELEFLAQAIEPPGTVLELGCGSGRVVKALAGRAHTIVGIDFLEPYVRQAHQRCLGANGWLEGGGGAC